MAKYFYKNFYKNFYKILLSITSKIEHFYNFYNFFLKTNYKIKRVYIHNTLYKTLYIKNSFSKNFVNFVKITEFSVHSRKKTVKIFVKMLKNCKNFCKNKKVLRQILFM